MKATLEEKVNAFIGGLEGFEIAELMEQLDVDDINLLYDESVKYAKNNSFKSLCQLLDL